MSGRWPNPLPCGHWLAELIGQVADGLEGDTAHQAGCEDCQRALATLDLLWEQVGALAREQVRAPASVDRAVLRRVRRELFVAEAMRVFGGVVPRVFRALLVYAGFMGEDDGS